MYTVEIRAFENLKKYIVTGLDKVLRINSRSGETEVIGIDKCEDIFIQLGYNYTFVSKDKNEILTLSGDDIKSLHFYKN